MLKRSSRWDVLLLATLLVAVLVIFARPMRKHTDRDAICFEPFSGSGSQIIAAEMNHRRCYAIEMEPKFCDAAVERWQRFTGGKAEGWRGNE